MNRERYYFFSVPLFSKSVRLLEKFVEKVYKSFDIKPYRWEEKYWSSCITISKNRQNERCEKRKKFADEFYGNELFRVIENVRGYAAPCKIVLLFHHQTHRNYFAEQLRKNSISYGFGYHYLNYESIDINNTKYVFDRVLELPIERSNCQHAYLVKSCKNILEEMSK